LWCQYSRRPHTTSFLKFRGVVDPPAFIRHWRSTQKI
jgi:hypothetical protein